VINTPERTRGCAYPWVATSIPEKHPAWDCWRFANASDVTTLTSDDPGGTSNFHCGMERWTCVTRCRPR